MTLFLAFYSSLANAQKTTPLAAEARSISEYEKIVKNGSPLAHEDSILIAFGQMRGKFSSLPSIPSPYGKCGTELAFEANRIPINKTLKDAVVFSAQSFTDSIKSPSGRFTIYFSKSGQDSTTEEYADSIAHYADEAYELEIVQLGYPRPPSSKEGDSTWHIFLQDLGTTGIYGFTQHSGDPIGKSPDGLPRYRAFNTIDNDFSESAYPTHGFDAARITVFHEFHHTIQFGSYGWGENDINFREMTSVWMEMRSTPEVKDYLQYISKFFAHISDERFDKIDDGGYSECIWMQFLEKKFGEDIIKHIWEFYSDKNSDFPTAFDSVLIAHSSNFCMEYERFGAAIYFTGRRFRGSSIFPDAGLFPIDALQQLPIMPASPKVIDQFTPISMSFFSAGYGQDSSVLVLSRNTDRSMFASCTVTNITKDNFTAVFDPSVVFCDTVIIFSPIQTTVFPNPYVISASDQIPLYILASTNTYPPVDVNISIFSTDNTLIRHFERTRSSLQTTAADPVGGSWYVEWDGRDDAGNFAPSGVYYYSLNNGEIRDNGKFVLIRKN